jgi:hypothetical protein
VDPADIWTEPPTSSWDVDNPTERNKSPALPPFPPPDPDLKEISPEFPDDESPVIIVRSPDTPEVPAWGVNNERDPELMSSLLPLEISIAPPKPLLLDPADK